MVHKSSQLNFSCEENKIKHFSQLFAKINHFKRCSKKCPFVVRLINSVVVSLKYVFDIIGESHFMANFFIIARNEKVNMRIEIPFESLISNLVEIICPSMVFKPLRNYESTVTLIMIACICLPLRYHQGASMYNVCKKGHFQDPPTPL